VRDHLNKIHQLSSCFSWV